MTNRGQLKYIPKKTLEELNMIKQDYNLNGKRNDSEAFRKMSEFSLVGREVDRMRRRLLLEDIWGTKKK